MMCYIFKLFHRNTFLPLFEYIYVIAKLRVFLAGIKAVKFVSNIKIVNVLGAKCTKPTISVVVCKSGVRI